MAKIAVLGGGAWGTALACHAARLNHDVLLWANEPEVVLDVNGAHENSMFLAGVPLPKNLAATSDIAEAVRAAEFVLLVPPSQYLRKVAVSAAPHLLPSARIIVASKGVEEGSLKLLSDVIAEVLPNIPKGHVAFLSGPSFAREVANGQPTDVVVASTGEGTTSLIQHALHAPTFRVYSSADPIGVQIGGAIKNVIAVAAGASDGLGLGMNARAALITRGLTETTRLGVALGADPLTFLGMSGVGDLVLTCTGDLSRNRSLGMKIAEGNEPKAYLASQRTVAEGFFTADAAYGLSQKVGVEMPITEQVYSVLHRGRPLLDALKLLMTREFKDELRGIRVS